MLISPYLSNGKQFATINRFSSETQSFQCGVPQSSVLFYLLFLKYISDLHNALKFSQSFHFANDTCLLNIQNTISEISTIQNKDLKELSFLLNANKMAMNVAKTEVIVFKTKHKPYDTDLSLKLIFIYAAIWVTFKSKLKNSFRHFFIYKKNYMKIIKKIIKNGFIERF